MRKVHTKIHVGYQSTGFLSLNSKIWSILAKCIFIKWQSAQSAYKKSCGVPTHWIQKYRPFFAKCFFTKSQSADSPFYLIAKCKNCIFTKSQSAYKESCGVSINRVFCPWIQKYGSFLAKCIFTKLQSALLNGKVHFYLIAKCI